jgi:hypothetical protein
LLGAGYRERTGEVNAFDQCACNGTDWRDGKLACHDISPKALSEPGGEVRQEPTILVILGRLFLHFRMCSIIRAVQNSKPLSCAISGWYFADGKGQGKKPT